MDNQQKEEIWKNCLAELGISGARLHFEGAYDPYRRIYFTADKVYKIEFPERTVPGRRVQNLVGEYEIYKRCQGCKGVGDAYQIIENKNYHALVLQRIEGQPLSTSSVSWFRVLVYVKKLAEISIGLASRGVTHNDLSPFNLLVSDTDDIWLVDFDQATVGPPVKALLRSFTGIAFGDKKVHASIWYLIRNKLMSLLPTKALVFINKLRGNDAIHDVHHRLPEITDETDECAALFIKAWRLAQESNASSPGKKMAYYSVQYCGYFFPGERPWEERWNNLRGLADFKDKRILELGCNMALLSCFLLKFEGAATAMAVDHDSEILESAGLIGQAMGVDPVLEQVNFDGKDEWENKLASFSPDVVFALNVLNWVKGKKNAFLIFSEGSTF